VTLPTILLVEDSEDDAFLMRYVMEKSGVDNPLQIVTDGQMALDYLSGAGDYRDRERFPLPFIVFLDLKLPYVHGFEVLAWIRQQPDLGGIPVVMLTGSAETRDRDKAASLGARSYIVKPPTGETLKEILEAADKL
jgi:CheY-like chemotaxis protein